jgi:hypothetical protein
MKTLLAVQYIREHGLESLIKEYSLRHIDYGHKVVIKYNQIDSPLEEPIVQECRGLVLEKKGWNIMSYPLKKFFNYGEECADEIDLKTAKVLEKADGTFIHVYWDYVKLQWCVGTTGTAEGEGPVNNRPGTSFSDLFWETVELKYPRLDFTDLNPRLIYMFELTSPYNQVVKIHKESSLTLLSIRDIDTLKEYDYDDLEWFSIRYEVPTIKTMDLSWDYEALKETFKDMPYSDEGYVVVDDNHNRIKIKNPTYVSAMYLKSSSSPYGMLELIKQNEVSEFVAIYPETKAQVDDLVRRFNALDRRLTEVWYLLSRYNDIDMEDHALAKKFAAKVFNVTKDIGLTKHSAVFFALAKGKIESPREYLVEIPNRQLYAELMKIN